MQINLSTDLEISLAIIDPNTLNKDDYIKELLANATDYFNSIEDKNSKLSTTLDKLKEFTEILDKIKEKLSLTEIITVIQNYLSHLNSGFHTDDSAVVVRVDRSASKNTYYLTLSRPAMFLQYDPEKVITANLEEVKEIVLATARQTYSDNPYNNLPYYQQLIYKLIELDASLNLNQITTATDPTVLNEIYRSLLSLQPPAKETSMCYSISQQLVVALAKKGIYSYITLTERELVGNIDNSMPEVLGMHTVNCIPVRDSSSGEIVFLVIDDQFPDAIFEVKQDDFIPATFEKYRDTELIYSATLATLPDSESPNNRPTHYINYSNSFWTSSDSASTNARLNPELVLLYPEMILEKFSQKFGKIYAFSIEPDKSKRTILSVDLVNSTVRFQYYDSFKKVPITKIKDYETELKQVLFEFKLDFLEFENLLNNLDKYREVILNTSTGFLKPVDGLYTTFGI
jgi:hypothetical protein